MIRDKELVYLIQPLELVGTRRYKIGYSKINDLDKFRKYHKKGSRFLDIYEYDRSPLLAREIRNNFNNKFKLIAGRSYYEGNENDIKNSLSDIINNYSSANNIQATNINTQVIPYTNMKSYASIYNQRLNSSTNDYMYIDNICYGSNCQKFKISDKQKREIPNNYYNDQASYIHLYNLYK